MKSRFSFFACLITKVRLLNPLTQPQKWNDYKFYIKLPDDLKKGVLVLKFETDFDFQATVEKLVVFEL